MKMKVVLTVGLLVATLIGCGKSLRSDFASCEHEAVRSTLSLANNDEALRAKGELVRTCMVAHGYKFDVERYKSSPPSANKGVEALLDVRYWK